MLKKLTLIVLTAVGLFGCSSDADVASRNLSQAADNVELTGAAPHGQQTKLQETEK